MTSIPQPQPDSPIPVLFCWSGGKDSALALHALRRRADLRVTGLLTTVTEDYDRISMHGVRRALLLQQAEALGLPLHEVRIPPQCVNPVYESCMEQALRAQLAAGVHTVAFGDIFLQDLRAYRERNLAKLDMRAIFPIWKRDARELAREFCQQGFRAIAVYRPEKTGPQLRRARTHCRFFFRSSGRRRPMWRKRRIPHFRLCRTHS